jgi:hypothetical protein
MRDEIIMMRVSEKTQVTDEELCACFISVTEGTLPCKLGQINANPEGNLCGLAVRRLIIRSLHRLDC